MDVLTRQHYADIVDSWIGKGNIIALVGSRRVGKSYVLKDFIQRHENDADINIIYIDKEKKDFKDIRNKDDLDALIEKSFIKGKHNCILIDEAQEISQFEDSVCNWYTEENTDVLITGSNSKMLSGELATRLSGRHVEIRIHPLTYSEFLQFHKMDVNHPDALNYYIEYGGMPGLVQVGLDRENAYKYLASICDTTLLKDVVMRNQIRNADFLTKLVQYMADNEGKLISASNISKYMKSIGETISPAVIINYQKMLTECYLLHKVSRYDIHGKRLFESNEKFYFEDQGIRNVIAGGRREQDIEKVIEGVIYQHLIRIGYEVRVGQLQAGEVDFVCSKPTGERVYVQASYIIADETTREREFGNLRKINDNYPKYVISMTPLVSRSDDNGITHLNLRRFLTEGL